MLISCVLLLKGQALINRDDLRGIINALRRAKQARVIFELSRENLDGKSYLIDLAIGDGKIVTANPDDKWQAELVADTDGEVKIRIDGGYLTQALKACGGMVDFKLTSLSLPMLFSANGYKLVVMPMLTAESQSKGEQEVKAKPTDTEPERLPRRLNQRLRLPSQKPRSPKVSVAEPKKSQLQSNQNV